MVNILITFKTSRLHRQHQKTVLGEGIIHMGEEGVFGRRGKIQLTMCWLSTIEVYKFLFKLF
ncbi:MAG: hypothetical protein QXR19_02435 [Candidatus Jordarchaeaceae archaeon]